MPKLNIYKYYISIFTYLAIINNGSSQDSIPPQLIQEILLIQSKTKNEFPWTYLNDTLKNINILQSSLRQAFDGQAGVQAFNGENFAQDVRIAIRGFGSRSAFGIRGIRLYQDGIPLTSPDGTTQLDEVSSFDISSMQVLRSGLAARLGNSAGGAIAMKSKNYENGITALAQISQYGSVNASIKHGITNKKWANLASFNHHQFYGKREYTESSNSTFYNKMRYFVSDKWQLEWLSGIYWSPVGTDPGALNQSEIVDNKYAANARNKEFLAGESVKGGMTALVSKYYLNDQNIIQSTFFYRKRDFEAKLPFEAGGWVDLNRDFFGSNQSYIYSGWKNTTLSVGSSIEYQNDHRTLSRNMRGEKGKMTADQKEAVFNFSVYQQAQHIIAKWEIHQLLRWDYNSYRLTDLFIIDGVQDGSQSFHNINGAMGLSYFLNDKHQLFSNFSTAFEMPSLNELSNNPSGPGFNPDLLPERSWQVEIGHKWANADNITIQTSAFYIKLFDQLTSYEIPTTPGRSYYRNAASSDRKGLELSINYYPSPQKRIGINYTWSDFKYQEFVSGSFDFSGLKQTLIPAHKIQLNAILQPIKWISTEINMAYNSSMWLNDANTTATDGYGEINLLLSTTETFSKKIQIGISGNNLFNLMPYSNFRVNAVNMRYFEVATPMYGSIFFRWNIPNNK